MYIAYFNPALLGHKAAAVRRRKGNPVMQLRRQAYAEVCRKYHDEIEAIRHYQPNWTPRF